MSRCTAKEKKKSSTATTASMAHWHAQKVEVQCTRRNTQPRTNKDLMKGSCQPHNYNLYDTATSVTQHVRLGKHSKRCPAEQTSQDDAPAYCGKPNSRMNVLLVAKQLQALLMALQLLLAGRAPAMT
jgi:hypothetical protein